MLIRDAEVDGERCDVRLAEGRIAELGRALAVPKDALCVEGVEPAKNLTGALADYRFADGPGSSGDPNTTLSWVLRCSQMTHHLLRLRSQILKEKIEEFVFINVFPHFLSIKRR